MTELYGDFENSPHGNNADDVVPRPEHLKMANFAFDHLAQRFDDMGVFGNRAKRRTHDLFNRGLLRIELIIHDMFEHMPFGKNPHREIVANNDDPPDIAGDHLRDRLHEPCLTASADTSSVVIISLTLFDSMQHLRETGFHRIGLFTV